VHRILAFAAVVLLSGCGVPDEPSKQAEEVHSFAAEGALLAHGAAEGSTLTTFTSEHAKAIRELLEQLRPAIEERRLARIATDVSTSLARLAAAPGDRAKSRALERRLENDARAAAEIAG
jgi:hypothetical protein